MSRDEYYSGFRGIKRSVPSADAPQNSFLVCDNYIVNRVKGGMMKRPGSRTWSSTGDNYGMGEFSKDQTSLLAPNVSYIIRHLRSGGISTFAYYNSGSDTWTSLTNGSHTSFGVNGITQYAMSNGMMIICGGRPAKLTNPTAGTIERLGGPAPTTAPTWAASGTGLTGTTAGFYTFYDSTTGWESSPSPITNDLTLSNQGIAWSNLETTCAREGVDQKRLYRTQIAADGEPPYYRVTTVSLATTSYADTTADSSLTAEGPDVGDHNPPPTESYLVVEYENRIWIASGSSLYYSHAYDGNLYQLEYFSEVRVKRFPARIMGLAYSSDFGRLLIFCPPGHGIHYISGRSESTFEQGVFKKKEGTHFPSSVEIHEESCAYWGTNGPSIINPSGVVKDFGRDIKEAIRDIATREYNGNIYIFCKWQPVLEQFLWFVSATDSAFAAWENAILHTDAQWEDYSTGSTVEWN